MQNRHISTREHLLAEGLDLLTTCGLDQVTLGVLAARSNVSKSGLFAHFKSKDQLQVALLNKMVEVVAEHVIAPAMKEPEGLPRLAALVERWLGWTARAGLHGGCPVAAGMFEYDDQENGPVRERLITMEREWRDLLASAARGAMSMGHLRSDLDVDQFVWELCGIYLSHHASFRFVQDPQANQRAAFAFKALVTRST